MRFTTTADVVFHGWSCFFREAIDLGFSTTIVGVTFDGCCSFRSVLLLPSIARFHGIIGLGFDLAIIAVVVVVVAVVCVAVCIVHTLQVVIVQKVTHGLIIVFGGGIVVVVGLLLRDVTAAATTTHTVQVTVVGPSTMHFPCPSFAYNHSFLRS